jgi:hypothetical protein
MLPTHSFQLISFDDSQSFTNDSAQALTTLSGVIPPETPGGVILTGVSSGKPCFSRSCHSFFDVVDSCVPLHQGDEAIDAHSFEKSKVFCHMPE